MTTQEFEAAYRLGQVLTTEGVRTSLAQEARKGRLVLVHELAPAAAPEQHRIQVLLRQLAPKDASQIIGTIEVDGSPVIVTKFLIGFTSLRDWLEASVAESGTVVVDTRDNPPTMDLSVRDAGRHHLPPPEISSVPALEDTAIRPMPGAPNRREGAVTPPQPQPAPVASSGPPAPSTPPPPPAPSAEGFTELFGATVANLPPATPKQPAPPEPRIQDPGAQRPRPASQQPSGSAPDGPVSEFSVLFGGGKPSARPQMPAPVPDQSLRSPPSTPRIRDPEPEEGSFTELFGAESGASPPLPAPPAPPSVPKQPPIPTPRRPESFPATPAGTPDPPQMTDRPPVVAAPRVRLDDFVPPGAPPPSSTDSDPGPFARGDSSGRHSGGEAPAAGPPAPRMNVPRPEPEQPVRPSFTPPPAAPPATPLGGSYTEVLTPARPPLTPGGARSPGGTAAPAPPAPPRRSLVPLFIWLGVLALVAIIVVVVLVVTAQ